MPAHLGGDEMGVLAAEIDHRDGVVLHGSSVLWGLALRREYARRRDPATLPFGTVRRPPPPTGGRCR
jgi:hypothetical protein